MVPVTFTEVNRRLCGKEYETRWYLARSIRQGGRITGPDEWIEATPEQIADWTAWQRSGPGTDSL
jgi:hypothetical protein